MELRELANNEASAFIERLIAAAEARAHNARAEAEQQVAAMRGEVDALRSELEAEATRAAAFEADLDSVIEAHRQVDGERVAAETARAQEAAARSRVEEELRGVRELLERARAEASRVSEALEDEAAEKALVQEELEGVRLTLAGLEQSYDASEKKIATLDARLAELEEIESALRAEITNLAARAAAVESETAAAAQAMRDRYDEEIRTARREVDGLIVERDAARADLDMIRTEADMLRGDLATVRESVDTYRQQVDTLTANTETLRGEAQALRAERDSVRGEAETLRARADALHVEGEKFKMDAAAARVDIEAVRGDLEAVRAEAQTARADADAAHLELKAAVQENTAVRADAEAIRADAELVRGDAGVMQANAETWRAQEEMLRAEVELSRDESRMLRMEIDKSRVEAEKLRAEAEKLRAEATILRENSANSQELATLQEMLDASREHHERQVATARELEAKLQSAEGRLQHVEAAAASTLASSIRAIDALSGATTISELFGTVVNQLASELPRVAIFRVKGNHLEGEHGSGFDETIAIKKIVIPMNLDSVITRAASGGGLVRADGQELAASRPPVGGAPVSAIAVPISFQGEALAVLYADSDTPTTNAHATFALLVVRHATVLLSRLTQELKVLKELREYAVLLLQEAEQMFIADVESGRAAHDSVRRLRDTVDCGRQLFAQRAALEGTEAAGLFDEQVSIVINAQASAFAEALGAATQDHRRAAS